MALEREKFKSEEAYRAGERAFKEKMVRLEASLRPKEFYNQLLGMATNPQDSPEISTPVPLRSAPISVP